MLAVYDRVIPSGSVPSLVGVGVVALTLYLLQIFVEIFRSRILTRVGLVLKEAFSGRTFDAVVRDAALGEMRTGMAVRDLDTVQSFLSSLGLTALFDLPWLPIYLFVCFAFHSYIGVTVAAGALALIGLTVLSNSLTTRISHSLHGRTEERSGLLASGQTHAEAIQAMGMNQAIAGHWARIENGIVQDGERLADISSAIGSVTRVFRMGLQSFVLGLGAFLVINHEATGGIMIASSILSARALAPIEMSIAHWKHFVSFRQSWERLDALFSKNASEGAGFGFRPPEESITLERVSVSLPNVRRLVLRDISFSLPAGTALGVVGPTGSGKSSLVRTLVGLWPPASGSVRADGQALTSWNSTDRGRFVGYLPQTVTLFPGTLAENIARFDPSASEATVVSAARAAGVHELVASLPDGYDTRITEAGGGLSGGQTQRIGLARALYKDPFLVVLDEPNSSLDSEGENALQSAIQKVKERFGIIVIVSHRPSILTAVDFVMWINEGRIQKYGRAEDVLDLVTRRAARPQVSAA